MSSIFSTQNLHTFLRRKNLRPPPPSRGGPPGPRPPPPPPPNRGRSPPGRSPLGRGRSLGADCSGALVSSAIVLLHLSAGFFTGRRESTLASYILRMLPGYAVAGASATGAGSAGAAGCALTFFFASRSCLIFSSRFCSS